MYVDGVWYIEEGSFFLAWYVGFDVLLRKKEDHRLLNIVYNHGYMEKLDHDLYQQ